MRRALAAPFFAALVVAALVVAAGDAWAYCPSYTASSRYNDHNCAHEAVPGSNPSVDAWQAIFGVAAGGPAVWGDRGPAARDLAKGCAKPEPRQEVAATFPCELLRAIAMNESGWKQFCHPDRPADQAPDPERTIISFDCGYGVGQITSGMRTTDPPPSYDPARVTSDPLYNLATGAAILGGKWRATKCVGDRQPAMVEHWYSATWAYNGLAYKNNPNNPNLDPGRGVWDPKVGGAYAYQERVFGWVEHPPSAAHWPKVELAYPDPVDIGGGSSPPELPEPSCASPTDCDHHRPVHATLSCGGPAPVDGSVPPLDGGPADRLSPGGDGDPDGGSDAATDAVPGDLGDAVGGGESGGQLGGGCGCRVGASRQTIAGSPGLALTLLCLALLLALPGERRGQRAGKYATHRR